MFAIISLLIDNVQHQHNVDDIDYSITVQVSCFSIVIARGITYNDFYNFFKIGLVNRAVTVCVTSARTFSTNIKKQLP